LQVWLELGGVGCRSGLRPFDPLDFGMPSGCRRGAPRLTQAMIAGKRRCRPSSVGARQLSESGRSGLSAASSSSRPFVCPRRSAVAASGCTILSKASLFQGQLIQGPGWRRALTERRDIAGLTGIGSSRARRPIFPAPPICPAFRHLAPIWIGCPGGMLGWVNSGPSRFLTRGTRRLWARLKPDVIQAVWPSPKRAESRNIAATIDPRPFFGRGGQRSPLADRHVLFCGAPAGRHVPRRRRDLRNKHYRRQLFPDDFPAGAGVAFAAGGNADHLRCRNISVRCCFARGFPGD